jgi:adenylate cyclase
MEPNNRKDGFQAKLENIKFDLGTYKILLNFQNRKDPLVIHFDKPARKFYFSLIALVVTEMKKKGKPDFIHIRKHEKILKMLDNSLAGPYASKTEEGLWDKIRKAWRYILPDLETGAHFKVMDRDYISPYEKGGKCRYECSDVECDTWANLFGYDENNKWRFKFSIDWASLSLNNIFLSLGDLRDNSAWQEFVKRLSLQPKAASGEKQAAPRRWRNAALSLGAVSIVVTVTVAIWNSYMRFVAPSTVFELPIKPSIAVLPLNNLSGDPEQEYFSDGLTEQIISSLSKVPKLFVIARNSTFAYKGKAFKVQKISKELGVRYVLEGSVRRAREKIRVTAQLIDALNGHHLWAEQYDRDLKDIFAVQDDITKNIISALQVQLTVGEQARAAAKGTKNLDAYLKYLQARNYIRELNPESNALAKQLAEEAIALDPKYAWAYYILGRAHMMDVWLTSNKSPKDSIAKSRELAKKAIALDNSLAEPYALLASLNIMTGEHDKAVVQAEKAVALNPNSADLHYRLGKVLIFVGRAEESIPEYKKAIRLDPIPPNYFLYSLGYAYAKTDQYDKAINWCEKAVRQQPDDIFAHIMMASVYSFSGRNEEAQAEAAEVLRINPKFSLEKYAKVINYKNKDDRNRVIEALRKTGLK